MTGSGSVCSPRHRRYPRVPVEQLLQGVESVDALLGGGGEVAPECEEVLGTLRAPEPAGYLLGDFHHPHVSFTEVVVERDREVGGEPEDVLGMGVEAHQEVERLGSLGPPALPGRYRWWVRSVAGGNDGPVVGTECRQLGVAQRVGPSVPDHEHTMPGAREQAGHG